MFFKEPIKVSQRTLNKLFFKALFLVPQRTFQTRVLQRTISLKSSSKNHFLKEFFKEPIKVSQRTFQNWFFWHHFWFQKKHLKHGSLKNHYLKKNLEEPSEMIL